MKNHSTIKGNRNIVVQDIEGSNINVNRTKHHNRKSKLYTIIGLVITALALIATIIVGWDNILKFFQK
jgi:hypothetical protein